MREITRREFLHVTAASGAIASLRLTEGQARTGADAGWFDRPMRWVQLTLVENDPGRFDPAFWLDYFRRLHADAATLSAGGIVAYYPTDVPLHHRSAWLGDERSVRRRWSPAAARSACTSSRAPIRTRCATRCGRRIRTGLPSTRDGQPRRHWANPELWVTCALGPYNFEFMDRVHREIVDEVQASTASSRIAGRRRAATATACTARRTSRRATGRDLPRTTDPRDPARRAFLEWRKARLTELWKHWDATVRAVNPEARFIPNGPPDLKTAGELAAIQFTDNQARRGAHAAVDERPAREGVPRRSWAAGRSAASSASALEEPYRWKDSVQSEPEIRLWVAEGTANGMRPWVTKFSGVLYDRRWLPVGRAHLRVALQARALPAQRGAAGARRRCSTPSRPRRTTPASPNGDRADDHVLGMYHALIEARVPFELVHEALLTPERLDAVQAADPRRRGGACPTRSAPRSATTSGAAAACSPRSPRRSTTRSAPPRKDFGLADRLRRLVRRPHRRADAELVSEPRRRSGDGPTPPDPRTASRTRRASSTACSASTSGRRSLSRRR